MSPIRLSFLEWVLAGLAALLLIGFGVQSWRAHSLGTKLDAAEVDLALYKTAQDSNLAAIDDLSAANKAWEKACKADPEQQRTALATLRSERDALQTALDRARNRREVIYARDPSARDWADRAIPAAVADELFPPTR